MVFEVAELIAIRKKYGISRDLVSNISKISSQNLYRYETKGVYPIQAHRQNLAQFLKVFREIEADIMEKNK